MTSDFFEDYECLEKCRAPPAALILAGEWLNDPILIYSDPAPFTLAFTKRRSWDDGFEILVVPACEKSTEKSLGI